MKLLLISALAYIALAKPQLPVPSGPPPEAGSPTPIPGPPPTPPPPGGDPTPTSGDPASTTTSNAPICECGYTYCASVLKSMPIPWDDKQLGQAYCATPNATCLEGKPESKIGAALFICLCEKANQKVGNTLDLLCGCDACLNVGPDNRARCATPCVAVDRQAQE